MQQDDDLEELERNPLDVTLHHIVKDLLLFFNEFDCLHEAKRMIEKKCAIKKEPEHKCWSEHYIKQAWKETIKEDIKSSTRKHWAHVIMLQVVKSFVCDTCKQNAAQKNHHATPDEQGCETTPNSEDRSSQGKAELETVGVEQHSGSRLKISKLTEESGAASGSQLSAFSTDEASSPAEVNSSSSETKNAALVNENEDTTVLLDNNCVQRRIADNYELCSVDVLDKENVILKNVNLPAVKDSTACDKAKSIKGSSKDRSPQRSAKPKTEETAGRVKRHSGENVSSASESEEASKKHKAYDTTYIRIPLTKLFGNKSPSMPPKAGTKLNSKFKLIDGPPEEITKKTDNEIKNKQFYVMSYNNEKKNAEWVYEIINMNTLSPWYKTPQFQDSDTDTDSDDPSYQAPNSSNPFRKTGYDRGHLAAAANYMWCQEAYEDTYCMRNITPQHYNLNRGCWKTLENKCRDAVKDDNVRNVHVYTGPLYLRIEEKSGEKTVHVLNRSEMKYEERKAVPTHYFKVLIVEKKNGTVEEPECFLIANEDEKTEEIMDIKSIERISGLKFTEDIPELAEVDHTRTAKWEGNKGGKSVTIAVRISSLKENDVEPHSRNEE